MIIVRKSQDRGVTKLDWLDSKHTFSFGDYYDPDHMGFRSLRVINEDTVDPGEGFPAHPHRDMEIITYIVSGALQHKDNMSHGSTIHPGEIQRMTAGQGVIHSEFNPSRDESVHLLQIWIIPETKGLEPGYEQKSFSQEDNQGKLLLIGSRERRGDSVTIHQDVNLYSSLLRKDDTINFSLKKGRGAWIQVVTGELDVNGQKLFSGDGAAISDEPTISLKCVQPTELLLFDLA